MGKKVEPKVKIRYENIGSNKQLVYWELMQSDGKTRLPVAEGGWNGTENNKAIAQKSAEHHARLAEQKLARKS